MSVLLRVAYFLLFVIPPTQATVFSDVLVFLARVRFVVLVFPARLFSVVTLLLLLSICIVPLSSMIVIEKLPSSD